MRAIQTLTNCWHDIDMSENDTFISVSYENRKTLGRTVLDLQ